MYLNFLIQIKLSTSREMSNKKDEDKTYIDDEKRYIIERNMFGSWKIKIISKELKEAIRNDIQRHKNEPVLKRGFQIPSVEFNKCMKKYGFEEYKDDEYPIEYYFRGYTVFSGDKDNEMWIKINFGIFYNEDDDHTYDLSAYYEGDEEYNSEILDIHWKTVFESIYNAIIAFLNDEDCSGERAKREVKEKERRLAREKKEALDAEFKMKENLKRLYKEERGKTLQNLKAKKIAEKLKMVENEKNVKVFNNNEYYNSNSSYTSPDLANVSMISYFNFNKAVKHQFIIAIRDKEHMGAVAEGDEVISYSTLNDIIALPAWHLSVKNYLCLGVGDKFVKESIHRSDITIALIEPTPDGDDTYFAGIATLGVNKDAIEIDLICSQIGYKLAGKLLMNKIVKIAKNLGKPKLELFSVKNPDTLRFYKKFLFKKVRSNNTFAKKYRKTDLIPLRRRITRKKSGSPAGGAGRK
jgi:hypothetical protein